MSAVKICGCCRRALPLGAFYLNKQGRPTHPCKECKCRQEAERHKRKMQDPEFRRKRNEQRAVYRERHRAELALKQRVYNRRVHKASRRRPRIDRQSLRTMYMEGLTVVRIAEKLGCSPNTVRMYACRMGIKRGQEAVYRRKTCDNCVNYPCFRGLENLETNFAPTCRNYVCKTNVKAKK